jgi:carbon-monoxide dehydrogenase large subunit
MTVTGIRTGGIGQPVLRKEDLRLLTGTGSYTDDVALPGQAHAVIVRSPHAHARILGIDASRAREVPGVLAVLTSAELKEDGIRHIPDQANIVGLVDVAMHNSDGSDRRVSPIPILADDKARFVGEAVAAVIGETLAAAQDGAEQVEVRYAELPEVVTGDYAVSGDAPLVWENLETNTMVDAAFGDPAGAEAAFESAEHVVELATRINRVTGVMLEPRAAVCSYDASEERFTLYCGGDNSVRLKRDIATVMGVPQENVHVIANDVGGNFGTRNWTNPEYCITAWASRRLGRPVRWTAARSEAFLSDYHGRDLYAEAALALDKDGRFLALKGELISNAGGHTMSYVPLNKTSELLTGVYDIPLAATRGRAVTSNTSPTTPYRSAGRPEAMFIMERLIELAARRHGFDAIELRRRNIIPRDKTPYAQALGLTYDLCDFPAAMERVLELGDWDGFPARREEAKARGRRRGIGLANYLEITSGTPIERAEITVFSEGRVDVVIGTSPSGQGHQTSFAQCVADWLGVPFEAVGVITGDTERVKEGGGSHSARSMRMAGIVMGTASDLIIEKGRRIAGHVLEAAESDIEFAAGRFAIKGTDRSMGIFEVAEAAETNGDLPDDLRGPLAGEHQELMQVPGYPYGAQVCEVEVDPETGAVEVVAVTAVDDVGRAINPLILHGQAHGGIAQGYGQALLEHAYYDPETGQMLAGSLMDYAMPRADVLPSFETEIMEVPTPTNPLGVRGGGEGGTTPALAVIVNAIVDALSEYGVTHVEMPANPERVWRAIHAGDK